MIYLSQIPQPIICVVAGLFGVIIGSFLNIFIHRIPECGEKIVFHDKIRVFGFFLASGRCQEGEGHLSSRYPIVEALTGFVWFAVAWRDGLTFALPFDLVFITALVALIFIDAGHMILPNAITYPGIVFVLVARVVIPYLTGYPHFDDLPGLLEGLLAGLPIWAASLGGALIGALIGGGFLWLMGWAWEKLRKVEAMGLGDVKMMFMVGAYFGWRLTILTLFLGALSGSVIGVITALLKGEKNFGQTRLPYGVYLGISAILVLLFGREIVEWYAGQF